MHVAIWLQPFLAPAARWGGLASEPPLSMRAFKARKGLIRPLLRCITPSNSTAKMETNRSAIGISDFFLAWDSLKKNKNLNAWLRHPHGEKGMLLQLSTQTACWS